MIEAILFGCGAKPLTGRAGTPGGAAFRTEEQQIQGKEETQAANRNPDELADIDQAAKAQMEDASETKGAEDDIEYAECGGPNGAKEQSRSIWLCWTGSCM